jgi:DNA-binding response OmpR family regulator
MTIGHPGRYVADASRDTRYPGVGRHSSCLCVRRAGPGARILPAAPEAPVSLDPNPILVVEDNALIREALCCLLDDAGLAVDAVRDGRDAVAWVASRRPALVVLDWRLPYLDGGRVAQAIRAAHGDAVPIVLITAEQHPAERAAQVGAAAFLSKPFDFDTLIVLVVALLSQHSPWSTSTGSPA